MAYSRAGYGRSSAIALPRPLDYMTREALHVLPKVLDAMGVKSVILIGHSDGATIAAIYAGAIHDPRLRAAVLVAPHFFTEKTGLESIAEAKQHYETGDLRNRLARHHENVDHAFRGWNDAWLDPRFRHWNVSSYIDGIDVPVLAVQGQHDQYGTIAQIEELEKRLPSQPLCVMIDHCRHSPHREQLPKFLEEISSFTNGLKL